MGNSPGGSSSRAPTPSPLTLAPSNIPSFTPSFTPTVAPSWIPTFAPSYMPTLSPSYIPTLNPTYLVSSAPTVVPSASPSFLPTPVPTFVPTSSPTFSPSVVPSYVPTYAPTFAPSYAPSCAPTYVPSFPPTWRPSVSPSWKPSPAPSEIPSNVPSWSPINVPSSFPSLIPSFSPSKPPTASPSTAPSSLPPSYIPSQESTSSPSYIWTFRPTYARTDSPTNSPGDFSTYSPSEHPSYGPSESPSLNPSESPTNAPSESPSNEPSESPTCVPSEHPSYEPSESPIHVPSESPTCVPSESPTLKPSESPSNEPSFSPTYEPSESPTLEPSVPPSYKPSESPSEQPTVQTGVPSQSSKQPSASPINRPSNQPSGQPSVMPTNTPSLEPSHQPSRRPSDQPSTQPTSQPTHQSTAEPSGQPSQQPLASPSLTPSTQPSGSPTMRPSSLPTSQPSRQPSAQPVASPTGQPSLQPSRQPSTKPSMQPTSLPSAQPSSAPSTQASSMYLQSALLAHDASFCDVSLSTESNEAGLFGLFSCSALLRFQQSASTTVAQLESFSNTTCYWVSARVIRILSSNGYPVSVESGAILSLREDSNLRHLQSYQRPFIAFERTVTVVYESGGPIVPQVAISAISVGAEGWFVDVSRSRGDCAEFWRVPQVTIVPVRSKTNASAVMQRSLEGSVTGLVFWRRDMLSSYAFPLQLNATFCNILNQCASSPTVALSAVEQSSGASSRVSVVVQVAPSFSLLEVFANESFVARASAFVVASSASAQMSRRRSHLNYSWSFRSEDNVSSSDSVQLRSNSLNTHVFRLPAFTLVPGRRYVLSLQVVDSLTGAIGRSVPMQVLCRSSALVALLVPSQPRLSMWVNQTLLLNASQSFDPDANPSLGASSLIFTWRCNSSDARVIASCTHKTNSSVLYVTASSTAPLASEILVTLRASDPKTHASTNTASSRSTTTSVVVEIVAASVPTIQILTPAKDLTYISTTSISTAQSRLRLQAQVLVPSSVSATISTPLASWSLVRPSFASLSALANRSSYSLARNATVTTIATVLSSLYIRRRALQHAARYVFRLQCADTYVDVLVSTNTAPFGGRLYVDPLRGGVVLADGYTLAGMGWKDITTADSNGDTWPLQYAFSFLYNQTWFPLQSASYVRVLEDVSLPLGTMRSADPSGLQLLALRLTVEDVLQARSQADTTVEVRPSAAYTAALSSDATTVTYLTQLLTNASYVSSSKLQQVSAALTCTLRSSRSVLSSSSRRQLLMMLVQQVRSSLASTDVDDLDAASFLLEQLAIDFREATLDFAKTIAPATIVRNTTSLQLQLQQADASMALLKQTILDLAAIQDAASSINNQLLDTTQIQLVLDKIRITIALSKLLQQSNSTSISFLPTITIPGSSNTINVVDTSNSSGRGSAVVSVAEYDLSVYLKNLTSSTSSSTLQQILSNIVSISVTYTSNTSKPVLPVFVANVSLIPGRDVLSTNVAPAVFEHNCSIGAPETVSFFCADSNVRMNLTCSGLADAIVRRKCPVPRRVCNVLNVQTASVVSQDYCVAVVSSATSVTCRCGFDVSNKTSSVIAGSGGAVAVAVMTEYVTSDFVNTVSFSSGIAGGAVSSDSLMVFFVFGSFWGFGLLLIGTRLFYSAQDEDKRAQAHRLRQRRVGVSSTMLQSAYGVHSSQLLPHTHSSGSSHKEEVFPASSALSSTYRSLQEYVLSALPIVLKPMSWFTRLWRTLTRRQTYLRLVNALLERDINTNLLERRSKRRKIALEIAKVLTDNTFSCFMLALLYDIQYPNDDGTCSLHTTKALCLNRRSPLDPSQTYCVWVPQPAPASAGYIQDISFGQVLQTVALKAVTGDTSTDDAAANAAEALCMYVQTNPSAQVTVAVAIFTSIVSLVLMQLLVRLFDTVDAPTISEDKDHQRARDVAFGHTTNAAAASRRRERFSMMRRRNNIIAPSSSKSPDLTGLNNTNTFTTVTVAAEDSDPSQRPPLQHTSYHEQLVSLTEERESSHAPRSVRRSAEFTTSLDAEQSLLLRCRAWYTRFKAWRDMQIHRHWTSELPEHTVAARKRFLLNLAHMTSSSAIHKSPSSTRDSAGLRSPLPLLTDAENVAMRASSGSPEMLPMSVLAKESDAEYGVCLLQQFIIDRMLTLHDPQHHAHVRDAAGGGETDGLARGGRSQQQKWFAAAARFFLLTAREEFTSTAAPVTETQKLLATIAIIACNLGALYYVMLKGIQRGGTWQHSFLSACLLQWVLEEVLIQTIEVVVVDFLVPGFIYRVFSLQVLLPLLQVLPEALRIMKDGDEDPAAAHAPSSARFASPSLHVVRMMQDRIMLPESVLLRQVGVLLRTLQRSTCTALSAASTVRESTWHSSVSVAVFVKLSRTPIELQRLFFSFAMSIVLGGLLLLWYHLQTLPLSQLLQTVFVAALLVTVTAIAWMSYRQQYIANQAEIHRYADVTETLRRDLVSKGERGPVSQQCASVHVPVSLSLEDDELSDQRVKHDAMSIKEGDEDEEDGEEDDGCVSSLSSFSSLLLTGHFDDADDVYNTTIHTHIDSSSHINTNKRHSKPHGAPHSSVEDLSSASEGSPKSVPHSSRNSLSTSLTLRDFLAASDSSDKHSLGHSSVFKSLSSSSVSD